MGHQGNSQPHVYLPASTSDLQGNQRGHIELMESPLGRFAALTFLTSAVSGTTPLLLSRLPLASGLLCLCFPRFSHCCPFSPARPSDVGSSCLGLACLTYCCSSWSRL